MVTRSTFPLISVLAAFIVGGCSGLQQIMGPQQTMASLPSDRIASSTGSSERKSSRRQPPASSETTGAISTPAVTEELYETRERELYSEMKKLRPGTPEWFAVKAQMDQNTAALRELNLSQLKICKGC